MAEAFLNRIWAAQFEAHSAGLEPGKLNPVVVAAMREIGIDISGNRTKSRLRHAQVRPEVFARHHRLRRNERRTMPDFSRRDDAAALGFCRPSSFKGTPDEVLTRTREVRDAIKKKIEEWCAEVHAQAMR